MSEVKIKEQAVAAMELVAVFYGMRNVSQLRRALHHTNLIPPLCEHIDKLSQNPVQTPDSMFDDAKKIAQVIQGEAMDSFVYFLCRFAYITQRMNSYEASINEFGCYLQKWYKELTGASYVAFPMRHYADVTNALKVRLGEKNEAAV